MVHQRWAKRKGSDAERELVDMFWSIPGWTAHRIAGSGSSKYPSPDIIAGSVERKIVIEAKKSKSTTKYFTKEEIESLRLFSSIFGAEPYVAIKFEKENWLFQSIEDLEETNKSFKATKERLKSIGLLFEEMIK